METGNNQTEKMLQTARSFHSLMGERTPFVIAIYNRGTDMIEFISNMEDDAMHDFIRDMADQQDNPVDSARYSIKGN